MAARLMSVAKFEPGWNLVPEQSSVQSKAEVERNLIKKPGAGQFLFVAKKMNFW